MSVDWGCNHPMATGHSLAVGAMEVGQEGSRWRTRQEQQQLALCTPRELERHPPGDRLARGALPQTCAAVSEGPARPCTAAAACVATSLCPRSSQEASHQHLNTTSPTPYQPRCKHIPSCAAAWCPCSLGAPRLRLCCWCEHPTHPPRVVQLVPMEGVMSAGQGSGGVPASAAPPHRQDARSQSLKSSVMLPQIRDKVCTHACSAGRGMAEPAGACLMLRGDGCSCASPSITARLRRRSGCGREGVVVQQQPLGPFPERVTRACRGHVPCLCLGTPCADSAGVHGPCSAQAGRAAAATAGRSDGAGHAGHAGGVGGLGWACP